jgi:hypothetical protein
MTRTMLGAATIGMLLLLGACGEKPQIATTRKPDTRPWESTQSAYDAAGFKPGDAAAWEQQTRQRVQNQNEYSRVPPVSK